MSSKIPITPCIYQKVVRVVVAGRYVVVVNGPGMLQLLMKKFRVKWVVAGTKSGDVEFVILSEVWLPVPRVERAVVACFAHEVKYQIVLQQIASTETVVEINTCLWAVEEHVACYFVLTSNGLKESRSLFAVYSYLVHLLMTRFFRDQNS